MPACDVETNRMTRKARPRPDKSPPAAGESTARRDCEEHREDLLDAALEESFPASDPPSIPRTPC